MRSDRTHSVQLAVLAIHALLSLPGCSDPSWPEPEEATSGVPVPGDKGGGIPALKETRPAIELERPASFVRVDLARSADGTVSLLALARTESKLRPVPSLTAQYLVAAYASERIVASTPIAFPSELLAGSVDAAGRISEERSQVSVSTATAFLELSQAIDHVAVLAPGNVTVLSVPAGELPARLAKAQQSTRTTASSLAQVSQALRPWELTSRFPHIKFLAPGDENLLSDDQRLASSLAALSEADNDVVAQLLGGLPPALLASVQRIGFMKWPEESEMLLFGRTLGSTVVMNYNRLRHDRMAAFVAHETTHAFDALTDAATFDEQELAAWPDTTNGGQSAQKLAQEVVRRHLLSQGLAKTFAALHATGIPMKLAAKYLDEQDGAAPGDFSNDELQELGVASTYGLSDVHEDLAEYVRVAEDAQPKHPLICGAFAEITDGRLPRELAIPYAKLTLLLGVGAIHEEAFERCTHGVKIDAQPGIRFEGSLSFESELKHGWRDQGEKSSFGILGSGPDSYRIMIELTVKGSGGSPLGLHRLENVDFMNDAQPGTNGVYVGHDNRFLERAATEGWVLVTEVTRSGAKGALFGLTLKNFLGGATDSLPYGTFSVP